MSWKNRGSASALPSMVSLMREKTVTYLKCHSRGFEKVTWPIACIGLLIMSIVLLATACGTQNWMELDVRNNASAQRGSITLGLLQVSHRIAYAETPIGVNTISSSYFLFDRLPLSYLARFHAAFGLSMVAILICLLNVAVTLVNSYQSVTTWWRGPTMMYLLSLLASLCSLTAVGLFLDHYNWSLDPTRIFISSTQLSEEDALTIGNLTFTSFQYLITTQGYHFIPMFRYSFYLEVAGACLPLLVTLLSWRLALLIPARKLGVTSTITSKSQETQNLQYFSSTPADQGFKMAEYEYPDPYADVESTSTISIPSDPSSTPISPPVTFSTPLQKDVLY